MRPMIDDLELPQVQVIDTRDHRALAEQLPFGGDGSLLQNLGRDATRVAVRGCASGPTARQVVAALAGKFRAGEPLPFTTDIATARRLEAVLIEDFRVRELAGKPERFAYVLLLREHVEPPAPADLSFLDDEIFDEASGLVDDLVTGLDLGLELSLGLERFVAPLEGHLETLTR